MIMSEDFNPETLEIGDRVRHADHPDNDMSVIVRFQAYPLVTLRSDSTGREYSANLYYLTKA